MNAAEAWEQVLKMIRRYGYPREAEALAGLDPVAAAAVRSIGWRRICMDAPAQAAIDRAFFCKIYEILKREGAVA